MASTLPARVAAAQATFDAFHGQTFEWGRRDCARLAAFCLKSLGYNPRAARFGYYKTENSAAAALRKAGFADMAAVVDSLGLPRIAPAAALPGDIVGFRHADQPLGGVGLGVCVRDARRVLCFLEDGICHVVPPRYEAASECYAWRAEPCR